MRLDIRGETGDFGLVQRARRRLVARVGLKPDGGVVTQYFIKPLGAVERGVTSENLLGSTHLLDSRLS